jgi:hypothetical protein
VLALVREPDPHAIAKELHARGHHHLSGVQPIGDPRPVFSYPAHADGSLAHRLIRRVDDKYLGAALAFGQGRERNHHACGFVIYPECDRCGHSEPHSPWRSAHSNADRVSSRGGVSLTGDFANAAFEARAGSCPERDLGLLAYREVSGILFGDRNRNLGLPGVGQRVTA